MEKIIFKKEALNSISNESLKNNMISMDFISVDKKRVYSVILSKNSLVTNGFEKVNEIKEPVYSSVFVTNQSGYVPKKYRNDNYFIMNVSTFYAILTTINN